MSKKKPESLYPGMDTNWMTETLGLYHQENVQSSPSQPSMYPTAPSNDLLNVKVNPLSYQKPKESVIQPQRNQMRQVKNNPTQNMRKKHHQQQQQPQKMNNSPYVLQGSSTQYNPYEISQRKYNQNNIPSTNSKRVHQPHHQAPKKRDMEIQPSDIFSPPPQRQQQQPNNLNNQSLYNNFDESSVSSNPYSHSNVPSYPQQPNLSSKRSSDTNEFKKPERKAQPPKQQISTDFLYSFPNEITPPSVPQEVEESKNESGYHLPVDNMNMNHATKLPQTQKRNDEFGVVSEIGNLEFFQHDSPEVLSKAKEIVNVNSDSQNDGKMEPQTMLERVNQQERALRLKLQNTQNHSIFLRSFPCASTVSDPSLIRKAQERLRNRHKKILNEINVLTEQQKKIIPSTSDTSQLRKKQRILAKKRKHLTSLNALSREKKILERINKLVREARTLRDLRKKIEVQNESNFEDDEINRELQFLENEIRIENVKNEDDVDKELEKFKNYL